PDTASLAHALSTLCPLHYSHYLLFFLFFYHFFLLFFFFFFFFNDTATTEIYTLSLHDALPIFGDSRRGHEELVIHGVGRQHHERSEEHTSELQSRGHLVCRLLLEKKKKKNKKKNKYVNNILTMST